jgi:schlafen family protein
MCFTERHRRRRGNSTFFAVTPIRSADFCFWDRNRRIDSRELNMDRDQVEKSELIKRLREFDTVACRICIEKDGEDWQVTHLMGDLNRPNSAELPSYVHLYTNVAFIRDVVPAEEFCLWIDDLKGTLRNFSFQLPEPHVQIQRERYSTGLANNHFYQLAYPFTLYTVSRARNEGRRRDPFTPLVKSGLPSFPNYETAFYRFMLNLPHGPGQAIPQDLVVVRVAHPEAWISAVDVEPNAVTVVLEGNQCEGTQLTIGSSEGVLVNEPIKSNGAQRFELEDLNSDRLWAVLSRDNSWIDWRDNRGATLRTTWDVSGVQPANLAANIEQLRLQGENERLEYKARVPDKEDKFLKTVAAFANGLGGIILVGIADDGCVEGLKQDVNKCMDAIVNSIRNRIVPPPIFELEKCAVDNKHVVAVFVKEGDEPPYGLNDKPPSIYVRRHGTTFDATPGEIRALGAKNQPSASYSRPYEF